MTPERWRDVSRIYGAVLTRPEADRPAALADLCANDQELRHEVESLLASGTGAALLDRVATDRPSVMAMANGLTIGSQIGVFRIDALLGVGGMGEVYRARDTKLNRNVAIKILPPAFASDPERLARFKREAQVLASLNHPNIGGIHGFEDASGIHALVLELVDGPTLADRIAKGALPIDEALAIARQIADALEAAHEQGIVHRDLKPANIKVREDGTVKVLDFGLAKVAEAGEAGKAGGDVRGVRLQPDLTASPTITTPAMTAAGMILGTAAYMSPEQAKGKPADKRSDIWAFGCVLYEMLTGARPFGGDDVSDTLAAILKSEPNWSRLPTGTPASIRRLLFRALMKDKRQRTGDVATLRSEIDDAHETPTPAAVVGWRTGGRERALWIVAAIVLAALGVMAARGFRPTVLPPEMRLDIATPPTTDPVSFAISPDGRKVVYVATTDGRSRLWLRELGSGATRAVARTEDAAYPFWSPDARSVGFFANGQLMRVDLDGDTVRRLAVAGVGRGGAWNGTTIVFAPTALNGLLRVSADGTAVSDATLIKAPQTSHSFPSFLPDGRHFLYFVAGTASVAGVYVGQLESAETHRIVEADASAVYDGNGHLLFVKQGTLFAQSFDLATFQVAGDPVSLADQIAIVGGSSNVAALSVSATGTVLYRTGSGGGERQLAWFDRSGTRVNVFAEPDRGFPTNPALSPDGNQVLMTRIVEGNGDVWSLDLRQNQLTRLTIEPTSETYPMFLSDGDRFVFTRQRDLYVRSRTTEREEVLFAGTPVAELPVSQGRASANAMDLSPDGRYLLLRRLGASGLDLFALSLDSERRVIPVADTAANEREGQFSKDGRWIAYQADTSGAYEIYVQRFPERTDRHILSSGGGTQPRWSPDGNELFYLGADGFLKSIRLKWDSSTGPSPVSTTTLFDPHIGVAGFAAFRQQYVVSKDGHRFLVNTAVDTATTSPIRVLLHWRHDS